MHKFEISFFYNGGVLFFHLSASHLNRSGFKTNTLLLLQSRTILQLDDEDCVFFFIRLCLSFDRFDCNSNRMVQENNEAGEMRAFNWNHNHSIWNASENISFGYGSHMDWISKIFLPYSIIIYIMICIELSKICIYFWKFEFGEL